MRAYRSRVLRSQAGASFAAVLMALVLVGALYFGYFEMQQVSGERSVGIASVDKTKSFACRMNRQTIERQMGSWTASHDGDVPTLDDLDAEVGPLASCPEGGSYSLEGHAVHCSQHP